MNFRIIVKFPPPKKKRKEKGKRKKKVGGFTLPDFKLIVVNRIIVSVMIMLFHLQITCGK